MRIRSTQFVVFALLLICTVLCQENLSPQNSTVALGQNGTFSCASIAGIVWEVSISPESPGIILPPVPDQEPMRVLSQLFTIGLFISLTRTGTSNLFIEGSISSNLTKVKCTLLRDGGFAFDESTPSATLRVFGPPDPPALQALSQGDNINFSWSLSFSPFSLPISYNLTLEDAGETLLSTTTDVTSHIYTPPGGFCSTLRLEVSAIASSGNSVAASNSSGLVYNMLTAPNTDAIVTSITHEVLFLDGEITCEIQFDAVPGCQEFPVSHYLLILQEITPDESLGMRLSDEGSFNGSVTLGPFTLPRFSLRPPYIMENTRYRYRVEAVNVINISSAIEPREFSSTDVQAAQAIEMCDSLLVQCTFLSGSQSRGCSFNLTMNGSVITRNIERATNSTSAEDTIIVVSSNVEESSAFDWESNGAIGSVPILIDIGSNCSDVPTSLPVNPRGDFPYILPVIGGVPAALIALTALLVVTICCCAVRKKKGIVDRDSLRGRNKGTQPAVLHAYNTTTTFLGGQENGSTAHEQEYNRLDYPSSYTGLNIQTSKIEEVDVEPIYSELTNQLIHTPVSTHNSSQPEGDQAYSQLETERDYAVLENVPPTPQYHSVAPPLPNRCGIAPLLLEYSSTTGPVMPASIPGYSSVARPAMAFVQKHSGIETSVPEECSGLDTAAVPGHSNGEASSPTSASPDVTASPHEFSTQHT